MNAPVETRNQRRAWIAAALLVLLVGVLLRVRAYAAILPMRIDEVRLALNVMERTFAELALPLGHGQFAPLGYLWLLELSSHLLGTGELALRAVSLAAGLLALPLVLAIGRRAVGAVGALGATALLACAPWPVAWSADAKQYSVDTIATLIVVAAALPAVLGGATRARALAAAVGGAVALPISHPAAFVTAGAGLALLVGAAARRSRSELGRIAVIGVAWASVFSTLYALHYRHQIGIGKLETYWARDFMPAPTSIAALHWIPHAWSEVCRAARLSPYLLALFVGAGLAGLWRANRALLVLLLAPFALAALTSAVHVYPFGGRMLTFAVPLLALLAGAGFELLASVRLGHLRWLPLLPLGLLLVPAVHQSAVATQGYSQYADLPAALAHVSARGRAGDVVFPEGSLAYPYRYYAPRFELDERPPGPDLFDSRGELREAVVVELARSGRVWILIRQSTMLRGGAPMDLRPRLLSALEPRGDLLETHEEWGVTCYLVAFR